MSAVEAAEARVASAERKVEKQRAHLASAERALEEALAELEAALAEEAATSGAGAANNATITVKEN